MIAYSTPEAFATKLFLGGKSEDRSEPIVARLPLGRLGEPEDIARAVSFLVLADGGWINGQMLHAHGDII